jgi:hypothetical protein
VTTTRDRVALKRYKPVTGAQRARRDSLVPKHRLRLALGTMWRDTCRDSVACIVPLSARLRFLVRAVRVDHLQSAVRAAGALPARLARRSHRRGAGAPGARAAGYSGNVRVGFPAASTPTRCPPSGHEIKRVRARDIATRLGVPSVGRVWTRRTSPGTAGPCDFSTRRQPQRSPISGRALRGISREAISSARTARASGVSGIVRRSKQAAR